jgi:effector-binding domain-containing protein
MTYVVSVDEVEAGPFAAIRGTTRWPVIGATIRSSLDEVWAHLRANPPGAIQHNVVLYLNDTPEVEIGVRVSEPFTPSGRVRLSATPAGLVAHTVHVGPYRSLGSAHEAVIRQSKAAGRSLTKVRWEVYGDWTDQEDLLETEVFYLLATSKEHGAA